MELKELIYLDDLSGLNNRRAFKEMLEKDIGDPGVLSRGLQLAFTDLDHFKRINDIHGHLMGDFMIKEFSKILAEGLKGSDHMIARYGGDEFVVILRGFDSSKALDLLDRIRQDLSRKEFILPADNSKVQVTLSLGLAQYPNDGKTAESLLNSADEALYSSKQLGRNRISLAKDILAQVKEDKRIQNNLSRPPLEGMDKALAEIDKFLFAQDAHKLVIVYGGMGSGKTRILEEVAACSAAQGRNKIFITCTHLQSNKPFSLIADIINALAYENLPLCKQAFDALAPKHKNAFSFFPGLKILGAGQASALSAEGSLNRPDLFQGMCELFSGVVSSLKPIIVVDNIDFIDEPTAGVIGSVIVSQKNLPLRICGSDSRQATGNQNPSFLEHLLGEISEFEIIPKVTLEPLSPEESKDLLKMIFAGFPVPGSFIDKIFLATKGNPFFITELLRDFLSRGAIAFRDSCWVFTDNPADFPGDMKELLLRKIDSLNQEEKEFLLAAAGIGQSCKFGFLLKLRQMNQGYAQDILEKTSGNNILSREPSSETDTLIFNNDLIRDLLYDSISQEAKKQLHLSIATKMEEENKGDLAPVSSELAFHFEHADLQVKVKEYSGLASLYLDKLFSNKETEEFLDNLLEEREKADKYELVEKEAWPLVVGLVSAFNSAIRSIQVYQNPNELSRRMAENMFFCLEGIFKLHSGITLSNPEGDSQDFYRLMVNGQDFPGDSYVQRMVGKTIIEILRDFDIGSITFKRGITKPELESFALLLSNSKKFKENKQGWKILLRDSNIFSIKIDEVLYRRVLSAEENKELHKEVLKDFISKKAAFDDVSSLLKESVPTSSGSAIYSVGKVESISQDEKNILAKTISCLPTNVIVEMILKEYSLRKAAILDIRGMIGVCLKNTRNKDEFLLNLRKGLVGEGISKESLLWLLGDEEFLKYPVRKRANIYLDTDAKTLLEMGVLENLKPTLAELFGLKEENIALEIIDKYLLNLQDQRLEFREYVGDTFCALIGTLPRQLLLRQVKKLSDLFVSALAPDNKLAVYSFLEKNTQFFIDISKESGDYSQLYETMKAVKGFIAANLHSQEAGAAEAAVALTMINTKVLARDFVEMLDSVLSDKKKSRLVFDMLDLLAEDAVPALLELLVKRSSLSILFEWYLQNAQIIELLKKHQQETLNALAVFLDTLDQPRIALAKDILNNFPDGSKITVYEKGLSSNLPEVAASSAEALIRLDTLDSLRAINNLFSQAGDETRKHLLEIISENSASEAAKNLLSEIKNLALDREIQKLLDQAMDKIEKRMKSR